MTVPPPVSHQQTKRNRSIGLGCGVVLAIVQLGILWGTSIPLGIPDEWTWTRYPFTILDVPGLWPSVLAGLGLCAVVGWGASRIDLLTKHQRVTLLLLLWGMGTLWTLSLVDSVPGISGLSRVPFVLHYERSSGYFTQARTDARNLEHFLATYRERIQDSTLSENYLHLGTHPPGLTTACVMLMRLCESSPALRNLVLATRPGSVRDSFEVVTSLASTDVRPLTEADVAAIWLAALLVAALAAGTCVPLYLLACRHVSRESAWWGAGFWLLVPAVAVFFPKSDVLFPCLAMWIQWLWLEGVDRRSLGFGAAAGTVIFLALCLTLAFAPLGLILLLQGGFVTPTPDPLQPEKSSRWHLPVRLRVYVGSGLMFGLWLLLAWWLGHLNLIEIWIQNLRNHAAFYDHATRSYLPWLLETPVELGFSLGLPLALCAIGGLCRSGSRTARDEGPSGSVPLETKRKIRKKGTEERGTHQKTSFPLSRSSLSLTSLWTRFSKLEALDVLIATSVWGLLWISGKNMGEAARLWVFLMPYALWLATFQIQEFRKSRPASTLGLFFVLQMVICLGTVLRIDGFHFLELMPERP